MIHKEDQMISVIEELLDDIIDCIDFQGKTNETITIPYCDFALDFHTYTTPSHSGRGIRMTRDSSYIVLYEDNNNVLCSSAYDFTNIFNLDITVGTVGIAIEEDSFSNLEVYRDFLKTIADSLRQDYPGYW